MPIYCNDCGGIATPMAEAGCDCTCEYGSCAECGAPFWTASQQAMRACGDCSERHAAEDARTTWQRRPTVEVPVLITVEACNEEALRRVSGRAV